MIERSAFTGNSAGANGGAIGLDGPVVASIRNSTFHDNEVANSGGEALDADGDSTVAFFLTTLYNNGSGSSTDRALATRDSGYITINHTIIATNWNTTGNCDGDISSNGFNIDSGSSCTSEPSDLPDTNPNLAPVSAFSDPGLPFQMAILMPNPSSPAIDGGSGPNCPGPFGQNTEVDQRGLPRPVSGPSRGGTPCDIGAIERQPSDEPLIFRDRFQGGF